MIILQNIVNILLLVAAVLLVVVVLLQDSKNSGLGSAFGSETTALSTRGKKASREKQLQKLTVILAIIVAVLAILMLLMPAFNKWFTPKTTTTLIEGIRTVL
ncbi:MAG: preprotein translocase subunit SecG [Clostridia bacterium]|nr:preprotein translocase subunit SecG [Clostridia bacterium]